MPTSKATASWRGGLKGGNGEFNAGSGTFSGAYTFPTRFEGAKGTNPEELIAAAHASCLSMALAAALEREGHTPERISTAAHCTLDMIDGSPRITRMRLQVEGEVPGMEQSAFLGAAEKAKDGCPVSNALTGNVEFELEARLAE